ncbi:TolC family protein [Novosphingobium sp. 9]|uniref:TolC family protein n=1 Tax=Novosphingobium sp. 9 TaxID=2025349 RepID=UPI0021B6CA41|nr:TolC family protein [Novosphingobium sp. 9]
MEWHPSIQAAIDQLKASGTAVDVAKSGYLPQVTAGGSTAYDNLTNTSWRPRASISATQMLYDFGKVSSSVAAARAGTRISEADVLLAVDTVVRDTSYAVIEIQRNAALHQVAVEQLHTIQGISDLVSQRFRKGAATRSDALQAESRVQSAQATLEQIEAQQRLWNSNLAHLLGVSEAPPVSSDVSAELEHACSRGEPDWDRIPAMMEITAEKDQAKANLRLNRANSMPTISLGAGASADVSDPLSRTAEYNFGLSVSSPLYSGGANQARTRGASFALGAAEAAEANVRNEVSRALAESQRQIGSYESVVNTLQARQESMKETGTLYQLQYLDMGTRTLVDLLNAQQEFHQARFDLVNTRHDLLRLNADCLYNSGAERDAFRLTGMTVEGVEL